MRILIIRHADPDYSIDSLTERGKVEAGLLGAYLSTRLDRENTYFYVSPLGRAKDTAKYTLDRLGANAETLDWLSEFCPPVRRPNTDRDSVPWDWLPEDWTAEDRFYSAEKWTEPEVMVKGEVGKAAALRYTGLDSLLEKHGYKRSGKLYKAIKPSHDTVVLFSHFGCGALILSRLLSVSPMPLWHGLCAAPSSITTVYSEERREGAASFRCSSYGATPHLDIAGEQPSFAARFCECFTDDTRH